MDTLSGYLCILVLCLAAVTAVGHGLWVLLARVFQAASATSRGQAPRGSDSDCPRCGWTPRLGERRCLECGLELDGPVAAELADLAATVRQLERFEKGGILNSVVVGRLRSALQIRRRDLRGDRPVEAAPPAPPPLIVLPVMPTPAEAVPLTEAITSHPVPPAAELAPFTPTRAEETAPPPWQRLEQLLAHCRDVRQLPSTQWVQALLWHGQSPEEKLASLPAPAQLNLARLLAQAGRTDDALRAFRRLLTSRPEDPITADAALEASRFAVERNQRDEAVWFLEQALARALSPYSRHKAEALLHQLRREGEPVPAGTFPTPAAEETPSTPVRQAEAATPAPVLAPGPVVVTPTPASRRRRSLGEVLAGFMEERNILWGELVGGLLIVGCSIALVISLWKTLEDIPFFPFLILAAVTAGLFGAGLYTLHHWKLESTSRGLLVIATLLVPLDFLVLAGFTQGEVSGPMPGLIGGAAALFLGWLLAQAARVLVPEGYRLLPLAVLGAAAAQLLVPYLAATPTPAPALVFLLGALPVAWYLLGAGGTIHRISQAGPLGAGQVRGLFAFLGMASYALLVALGFLLGFLAYKGGDVGSNLNLLAVLFSAAGIPVLAAGIFVHRGLEGVEGGTPTAEPAQESAPASVPRATLRTAGTAVLLLGLLIMLVAVVLAWPQPVALVVVCAFNATMLMATAFRQRLPALHGAAIPCLVAGYLSGFNLLSGNLAGVATNELGRQLLHQTLSGWGGAALVVLVLLLAAAAEVCARLGRGDHALWYALGSGAVALLSWGLVSLNGLYNPERAALVVAIYAAVNLALNVRWRRPLLSYFGLLLALSAVLWTLEWRWPLLVLEAEDVQVAPHLALWGAVLAALALVMGLLAGVLAIGREERTPQPLAVSLGRRIGLMLSPRPFPLYLTGALARVGEWTSWPALLFGVWAGLLLPWQFEYVVIGVCLFALYLVLAAVVHQAPRSQRATGLARRSGLMLIGTVIASAGWGGAWYSMAGYPLAALIGQCLAATSTIMAAVSVWATRTERAAPRVPQTSEVLKTSEVFRWYGVLASAWRETAALAALLGLAQALFSDPFPGTGLHTASFGVLAATAFLLAWRYNAAPLSWVASVLALAAIAHGLYGRLDELLWHHRVLIALLTHATLGMLGALAVRVSDRQANGRPGRIFVQPLLASALGTTFLAVPLLLVVHQGHEVLLAGCMGWLAVLWLVLAWVRGSPLLFTAYQAALTLGVAYGLTGWLERQPWVHDNYPAGLAHPVSLQVYGIGLAVLSLIWVLTRLGLRSDAKTQRLLEPSWLAPDRVVLGLVVLGQLVLATWGIVPGVLKELTPAGFESALPWIQEYASAFGPHAWVLLGILAVVLMAALWDRRPTLAMLGLVVLAMTFPVLAAGRFETNRAAASALRWGLGMCFLACSALLWLRGPLAGLAGRAGIPDDKTRSPAERARGLLVAGLVVPVLSLTASAAWLRLTRGPASGPELGTFFTRVGGLVAGLVPLGLVSLALVGHALRERAAIHAFAAGLVANFALLLGYALGSVSAAGYLAAVDMVRLLQWGSVGAGAWAVAWLLSRRWVNTWRAGPEAPHAQSLMTVQIGMGLCGIVGLQLPAMGVLVLTFPRLRFSAPLPVYLNAPLWVLEVGSALGWLALDLVVVAAVLRHLPRRLGLPANGYGLVVLAALSLLACTVERAGPGSGYRTLMIGCGLIGLAVCLGTWGIERRKPADRQSPVLNNTVTTWVLFASLLALGMGLKAAVWHHDHLWAAAAIVLASLAGAALGVWHRREDWAFAAGLGVNLAVSLVVWHLHRGAGLEEWWVTLVQANVIANAAGTMLWLWMRRQLYDVGDLVRTSGPFLAVQVALGLFGNALLLLVAMSYLVGTPGDPPLALLGDMGQVGGWLALLLAVAAALGYLGHGAARIGIHLVGSLTLALGILAACTLARWDSANWLAYHLLTVSWVLAGLVMLLGGWISSLAEGATPFGLRAPHTALGAQGWVAGIGVAVVLLALRGAWEDPQRPYWSAGAVLAVSGLAGGLAVRAGRWQYVYASGLLINLAAWLGWLIWGPDSLAAFLHINVLCLGLTSAFWTLVELPLAARIRLAQRLRPRLPYSHAAVVVGLATLTAVTATAVFSSLTESASQSAGPLAWMGLAALALALVACLWDEWARFTLPGMYVLSLIGFTLPLVGRQMSVAHFGWNAVLMLACFILWSAVVAWCASRLAPLWQTLRVPRRISLWPEAWFLQCQLALACLAGMVSLWVSLDFSSLNARLGGPVALLLLLPAGMLLANTATPLWGRGLRTGTLALGVLILIEVGWALLGDASSAPWLERNVLLMVVLALAALLYRLLPRIVPRDAAWTESARWLWPRLGALAAGMVAVVLVHEATLYSIATQKTPLTVPGIIAVAVGLVVLMVTAIRFAVLPGRDPLGWPERRRTLYVYGCELLLVLLFVHLRLNVPGLFSGGARYWTLIVMGIAFLGVGLSEYFTRRGQAVLAEPLHYTGIFLPLLPLLAFWLQPALMVQEFAQDHAQALAPLLKSVKRPPGGFGSYAVLWFTLGALYAVVSVARRSFWFGLLAALACNFGLWAMLYHHGWSFLIHPQMWLIPLALILLAAEHVNRDRLSRTQSTGLRYLALGMLYLSSTADMFITGVGNSVMLPLVLALLAVLGVLAGILLRVRAFLFLGFAFLFLDIFAMIWHAAVDRTQTWVWWASGIVLGIGIVALFAVFEKRRNDVLRLIEDIKKWD